MCHKDVLDDGAIGHDLDPVRRPCCEILIQKHPDVGVTECIGRVSTRCQHGERSVICMRAEIDLYIERPPAISSFKPLNSVRADRRTHTKSRDVIQLSPEDIFSQRCNTSANLERTDVLTLRESTASFDLQRQMPGLGIL
ncbi:hypothetical protein R69776_04306 [Paraburkholderia nemoris]|uniref:Uncharacterized protein n=1 Tax=Paraburkholderia nemoris TaxID=2793076 RepID=A0ABM8RZV0_9BURK|nr:hypothetical protein R75777_03611 [Paraburkholderia nemoris]CAE6780900.1 hypothetical protein R69776_04306 [Paraburkholderia nemoris]